MCIIEISALKLWGYDYVVIRHRQLRLQLKGIIKWLLGDGQPFLV